MKYHKLSLASTDQHSLHVFHFHCSDSLQWQQPIPTTSVRISDFPPSRRYMENQPTNLYKRPKMKSRLTPKQWTLTSEEETMDILGLCLLHRSTHMYMQQPMSDFNNQSQYMFHKAQHNMHHQECVLIMTTDGGNDDKVWTSINHLSKKIQSNWTEVFEITP